MSTLYSVIKKPAQIIEVFSACNYFNIKKLICFVPKTLKVRSNSSVEVDYFNYINSLNKKNLNFKIVINKFKNIDEKKIINKLIKKKNISHIAIVGDNSYYRLLIYFKKKFKTIAITDGPYDSFNSLNYFIIIKSKKFINYFKIPLLFFLFSFFKLDYSFTYFKKRKYLFSKKEEENTNFQINNSIKKKLNKKKIDILIVEDPSNTLSLEKIIIKYNLKNKNFCTIAREGVFKIGTNVQKKVSIIPEVLLSSGIIKKVYTYPLSGVYNFAKSKKIKTIKLPINVFHYDGCAKFFSKYIIKRYMEIK